MNDVTKYWIEKANEAIRAGTYRVLMNGHSLDLDAILNYPKGNRLLRHFKWYREQQMDKHIRNLEIETWNYWKQKQSEGGRG